MADYRVISSDNHIVEPPNLWLDRMEPGFRDQAPAMRDTEKGPFWFVEDKPTFNITSMASQAGQRFEDAESLQTVDAWENARPGAYIPEEAIKDMDFDGIDVGIVYPEPDHIPVRVRGGERIALGDTASLQRVCGGLLPGPASSAEGNSHDKH